MLAIDNLNFSYDDNQVFKNFSLKITNGTILCILGENGSGKTTLLKVLAGLNYCPQLSCIIDNQVINQNYLKRLVTYFPTSPVFYNDFSVKEYILWIKELWKKDSMFIDRVYDYLNILNLKENVNVEIGNFSLGMKYKLYFCTFLALDNPILLLDEPLNSLDLESRKQAIKLIKKYINEKNGYCIFSSHVKDTITSLATESIRI